MKGAAPRLRTLRPKVASMDLRVATVPPKQVDPYYSTAEHREWREAVVRRAGGKCQSPDCDTPERAGRRLFADHIKELRDGGAATELANGIALCGSCHSIKTAAVRRVRMAIRT
jgi:5-methylcytosine-specific restriction enzyme A